MYVNVGVKGRGLNCTYNVRCGLLFRTLLICNIFLIKLAYQITVEASMRKTVAIRLKKKIIKNNIIFNNPHMIYYKKDLVEMKVLEIHIYWR